MNVEVAEYMDRMKRTKAKMAEKGIEVLLITDPANMNYLTGFDGWSFYVDQMLVLMDDEEQPIWIGRTADANAAKVTTWLFHENIIPYPDTYVHSQTRHPMDFVAEILTQIGQDKRNIGVEMDSYYFSAKCFQQLNKGLSNATFLDGSLIVNWVRIIKSPAEILKMEKAGIIGEHAMREGIEMVNAGVRGCDVAAKISHEQLSGTPEFGGDYPAIVPLLPAGERTSTPHLTWTDKPYQQGETVILELAGCYQRYHAPIARTVQIGQPSTNMKNLSEVVIEGLNACLDFIQPGVVCEEIETVWRKTVEKHGVTKESRLGYSMGLNYPPDWGEHTASIRTGDKTILVPNMTFHLIPAIWSEGDSFEISESFYVTENGCKTFANLPRELMIKDGFANLDFVG
ncbi:ectoine hydrolase DoeA [Oceanobacillus sp. E9]|uniref:M24 family metallopeptidase n=1 Tax=Oceanobacillus TaxID=182709 RepID=UPI00084EB181|nr:M24 family metallopeptidase [Oceanobacillus sp. E9]OEH55972.1 ectoine hydrolase DoeA [Oceanobacillus sp. E9]